MLESVETVVLAGVVMEQFLNNLRQWGLQDRGIRGIALVGSHARGTARPGSDIDVVILADDSAALRKGPEWIQRFGVPVDSTHEDWGAVQSRRVHYVDGKEVEFGYAAPEWASTDPCDEGTLAVVRNGFQVVYDPQGLLRRLAIDAQPDSPQRYVLVSSCGAYQREAWFLPGPHRRPQRLAVFLDGEFYLHDMRCLDVVRENMDAGTIPPMSCLFVSFINAESRQKDHLCNARYSRFLVEDVVDWARHQSSDISAERHLICGMSLSGLAAAYAALCHPGVFSSALCQSGSFWWLEDNPMAFPSTNGRFWLSVGDQETETGVSHPPTPLFQRVSQIEGVEAAVRRLESCGGNVRYNHYSGGHTFSAWREEFAAALRWLTAGSGL